MGKPHPHVPSNARVDNVEHISDNTSSSSARLGDSDHTMHPRYVSTDDVRDSVQNMPASIMEWDLHSQRNAEFEGASKNRQHHSSSSTPLEGMRRHYGHREFIPPPLTAIAEEPGTPSMEFNDEISWHEPPACISNFAAVPSPTLKRIKPTSSLSSLYSSDIKAASTSPSSVAIDLFQYQSTTSFELCREPPQEICDCNGFGGGDNEEVTATGYGVFDEWGHFVEEGAYSAGRSRSEFFHLIGTKRQY